MENNNIPSHHGVHDNREVSSGSNETLDLLLNRASCRIFDKKPITDELLKQVLEAGNHAPTGGNLQPYSIIGIRNESKRKKLSELCGQRFIARAPVNLLFCIDWKRMERWAKLSKAPFTATSSFRHFWISFQDTVICAQNICTAADAVGLGSVYIGTSIDLTQELKDMFELPEKVLPVVLLCLGYPKRASVPRLRLGLDVIYHEEKYNDQNDAFIVREFEKKYEGHKVPVSGPRLSAFRDVCMNVFGDEAKVENYLKDIKEKEYFNTAQHVFGLHYKADSMPCGNEEFLKMFKQFGFDWFENFEKSE